MKGPVQTGVHCSSIDTPMVSSQANVDGIQYPSLHVDHRKVDNRLIWNYAFPATSRNNASGYCEKLRKWFYITEPVSWAVAKAVNPPVATILNQRELHFNILPNVRAVYSATDFGRMQRILEKTDAERI